MANTPKLKNRLTHAYLLEYEQAMILLSYKFTNEGQERSVLFSGQVKRVLTAEGLDLE